jgi:hypothetical protein
MLASRRRRFGGAGDSAAREFKRLRQRHIREDWQSWLVALTCMIGSGVSSFYVDDIASRVLAATSGFCFGVLLVVYALGGHISAFRWWQGALGERDTAKEIEKLSTDWHCEHDLEYENGNYDHVLVGPPGIFLLDSKLLHNTSAAGDDALRAGRLLYPGTTFRSGAKRVNSALARRLGFGAPWVQSVVVVWGDFPQGVYEEQNVVYARGEELVRWLTGLSERINAPQRAACVTALREVRESLKNATLKNSVR